MRLAQVFSKSEELEFRERRMRTQMLDSPQTAPDLTNRELTVSCNFSPTAPRMPSVTAAVGYLTPTTVRPYNYMYQPPAGQAWQNCEYQMSIVMIGDARAMASPPSIHSEGFELWDAPTSMVDFDDEDAVRSRYYAEAAELARCVTGAEHAYVFDHLVRRREAGRPALGFGRKGDGSCPAAVGRVHNDYSETSGQKRFQLIMSNQKNRSQVHRFAIVNIWRSIRGKIVDTPLAVCDARTISVGDLVTADVLYPSRSGEIYLVLYSVRHNWAYFSEMDSHEALVFKQYDSNVNGVARFTPHSAFDLPNIPLDAPLRESIEVRCLVTYG